MKTLLGVICLVLAACGPNGNLVTYPIGGGPNNNVVVLVPDACILSGPGAAIVQYNGLSVHIGEYYMEQGMDVWNAQGAHFRYNSGGVFPENDVKANETVVDTLPVTCAGNLGVPSDPAFKGQVHIGEYQSDSGELQVETIWWTTAPHWTKNCSGMNDPPEEATACLLANSQYEALIAHELAHSLGMGHVTDPMSIMYWENHPYYGVQQQDRADLDCAQFGINCNEVDYDTRAH